MRFETDQRSIIFYLFVLPHTTLDVCFLLSSVELLHAHITCEFVLLV